MFLNFILWTSMESYIFSNITMHLNETLIPQNSKTVQCAASYTCTCLPVSICSHTQELTPYKLLNMSLISLNFTHLPNVSFLVSQFCTLESSLCVSSSDYYLISPFGSSLIKVVLNPKIRTTECTHQTTSVHRMNS